MKLNIALVFPESTFLIDPMVYPPLGLWYLAAHLENFGHNVEFFDLSEDEFPNDGDFDQLWMSATSPQMHRVKYYGDLVRGWTKTATVLGGAAPWARPKECLDLGFDVVVEGEADAPQEMYNILESAETLRGRSNGTLLHLGTRLGQAPALPPVRKWSHRYTAYLEDRQSNLHKTTTMFTSRGCPMACAFCESGRNGVIWDRTVRYEPLDIVRHQLREIADLGFTGIMFYDDILPLNKPRMLNILDELKRYDFTWRCFIRTDVIAKQGGFTYLKQMRDAGLVEVLAGVESASNQIKDNIWKGTTIEQDTQALQWCKELGIKFKASFILGLPGENQESMEATKRWILEQKPDRADVNILIPFPGTPITSHAAQFDLYWTEDVPETFWYKGPRDESNALVGTSSLKPIQIEEFRNALVSEMEETGIPY
jgi:anaerobic magnesium-protoporphyrin IX monomethyl ester cyclase